MIASVVCLVWSLVVGGSGKLVLMDGWMDGWKMDFLLWLLPEQEGAGQGKTFSIHFLLCLMLYIQILCIAQVCIH